VTGFVRRYILMNIENHKPEGREPARQEVISDTAVSSRTRRDGQRIGCMLLG
jgi:hypothetical protein